jgi:MFS family permease
MNLDQPAIRRATIALLLTQSIASAALITSGTVNPLVAAELGGQAALAGLPSALVLAGASLAAYPAGQLMGRLGRRYGLIIGCAIGMAGALLSGVSIVAATLPLFLAGLLLMGAGRGTLDQGRYAAAEINPPHRRARAMSTVVFGGTVGAVLGPALVAPAGEAATSLGLEALSGPYFVTSALFVIAAIAVFILLAVDLRGIAQRIAQQYPTPTDDNAVDATTSHQRATALDLFRIRDARVALITMICAQAAMVMMMAIIGLHMTHHDHGLGDVSLVTMAHVLGMFAFAPFIGQLADRVGRRTMIGISAVVIGMGCVLAPLSLATPWIALALFLVGLGWSGCYITGSTLLTDAVAVQSRARMQGANDTLVNIASAGGSLSSGVLLQAFGFNVLSIAGLTVALLPVLALLFNRPPTLSDQPSVAK